MLVALDSDGELNVTTPALFERVTFVPFVRSRVSDPIETLFTSTGLHVFGFAGN